jgi:hypothetical protein
MIAVCYARELLPAGYDVFSTADSFCGQRLLRLWVHGLVGQGHQVTRVGTWLEKTNSNFIMTRVFSFFGVGSIHLASIATLPEALIIHSRFT